MTPDTDRTQSTDLETLARARFTELTAAEIKLLRAAPKGEFAVCGPSMNDDDSANDLGKANEWGADRHIRADLIRWLCVDRQAKELVDPKGIQAYGARIPDALDLSYVAVPFSLTLWHCRLMGPVNLRAVEIPKLDLQGTWVRSIAADRAHVKGNVFLRNGFRAEGEVRFPNAQIGADLDCGNATFENPPQSGITQAGDALVANKAVVRGGVYLRNGFRAEGTVWLLGAQIGGDLDCSSATFSGQLIAQRAAVKGGLFWRGIVHPERAKLDLIDASVGVLDDDAQSWPAPGNLILDGFVYQRISAGPRDAKSRLEWLARQKDFRLQPYRQLAKVLRDEGNDAGARLVLFEMEHRRRKQEDPGWLARTWSRILRWTIGYGYYPGKALWWLAGLTVLGLVLFWGGYAAGSIAPTDKDAYSSFKQNSHLPPHYESFYASIYSLENALPLVKLGQIDRWQPDPNAEWICKPAKWVPPPLCVALSPTPLRWFRWAQICLGWILATLFVAGVTGIVRKD